MIARARLKRPIYVTERKAKLVPSVHRFMAEAFKPDRYPEFDGDGDYKMLDVVVANDGQPCKPKIQALIVQTLGEGWCLVDFWQPEPEGGFEPTPF